MPGSLRSVFVLRRHVECLVVVGVLGIPLLLQASDPAQGESNYQMLCAHCHGATGVTVGASLYRLSAIAAGRRSHGGGTQPFGDFQPSDLEDVSAFLSGEGFQDFQISGTVTDELGGPVPGVTVTVTSSYLNYEPHTTETDADGAFAMNGFPAGDHSVELSAAGMLFSPTRESIIIDGRFGSGEGLEYRMYRPGQPEPPPLRMVQRVSPAGDDFNDGRTWATAKLTIGEALRQLPEGGEVWLTEGTYYEPVVLRGRSLYGGFAGDELRRDQRDWIRHPTFIDGTPGILEAAGFFADSLVVVDGADFNRSVLDGVTLQNAQAFNGAGIRLGFHPLATIQHCQIVANTASDFGGAIYCSSGAEVDILGNLIRGNSAASGGGVWVQPGGVIHLLANNLIDANHAQTASGVGCDGLIELAANNTFVRNESELGSALTYGQGVGTNWNNIVAYNSSGVEDDPSLSEWRHNAVFGNGAADWLGTAPAEGDVLSDPLFVDISLDDFRLAAHSPCVDAGVDLPLDLVPGDLAGQPRRQRDGVDMGALELPAPRLSVTRSGTALSLAWPGEEDGLRLERRTDLEGAAWTEVTGVSRGADGFSVHLPLSEGHVFFRLHSR